MWIRVALDKANIHSTEGGYTYVLGDDTEEFYFSEEIIPLLDEDGFILEMWNKFDAQFDWGDCDYFDCKKCEELAKWLDLRMKRELPQKLREVYLVLREFCDKAVTHDTGIEFDF